MARCRSVSADSVSSSLVASGRAPPVHLVQVEVVYTQTPQAVVEPTSSPPSAGCRGAALRRPGLRRFAGLLHGAAWADAASAARRSGRLRRNPVRPRRRGPACRGELPVHAGPGRRQARAEPPHGQAARRRPARGYLAACSPTMTAAQARAPATSRWARATVCACTAFSARITTRLLFYRRLDSIDKMRSGMPMSCSTATSSPRPTASPPSGLPRCSRCAEEVGVRRCLPADEAYRLG